MKLKELSGKETPRLNGIAIGAVRILAGLMWLANMEWKRPPDFGRTQKNGLYKYVDAAITNEVFGPWSWIVKNIVLKQYTLFGWSTLLIESALAALLLLGLWTRLAALVGAAISVTIALSVLHYPHEWPWSYYLMIGLHLILFATNAGHHLGLDGVLRAGHAAKRRATMVLGAVATIVGIGGLIVGSATSFTAEQGRLLGWAGGEAKFLWFNPFSGLLTLVFGVIAVLAVRLGKTTLTWVSVAGFTIMSLQVLLQWRYLNGTWTSGLLGGTGANFAFWAMLALGFAVCRTSARAMPSPRID